MYISYVLFASFFVGANDPMMSTTGVYPTYQKCVTGAKHFYYDHALETGFPDDLPGGISFTYKCLGTIQRNKPDYSGD